MMRWRLDDLFVFRAIADGQGITAAAQTLDMPKSTVSKTLSRLEEELGIRLVERSSRKLCVTPEGETLLRQAQQILEMAEQTDAMMAGMKATPSGKVTMAVPSAFCRDILAPNLPHFRKLYPEISLELVITTQPVDLIAGGFDLAVVVGVQPDSELSQRMLLAGRLVWVTSPAYLLRANVHALRDEIPEHIQICESRYAAEPLDIHIDGVAHRLTLRADTFRVNDPISVREAVLQGMGVSFLPERYCIEQIEDGSLIEIWPHVTFDQSSAALSVLYSGRNAHSPRRAAVVDFLAKICQPDYRTGQF